MQTIEEIAEKLINSGSLSKATCAAIRADIPELSEMEKARQELSFLCDTWEKDIEIYSAADIIRGIRAFCQVK